MPDPIVEQNCNDWASYHNGDYILSNNVWNKGTITDCEQCISFDGESRYGWKWRWPDIGDGQVRAYPEIIFGWKPWDTVSTTTMLPRQLSSLNAVNVTYEIESTADGIFNTAFDLWLTSGATPSEANITTEVMVWVANQGQMPAGNGIEVVPATMGEFVLYKDTFDHWIYYAFVIDTPILGATINLNDLLQYLVTKGYVKNTDYLASVEFGNEIVKGTGSSNLKQYKIEVS